MASLVTSTLRGQVGELGEKPGGLKTVKAFVPLAEMFNYVSKLRGMTKGRANYSMKLARYEPVPMNIQKELRRPRAPRLRRKRFDRGLGFVFRLSSSGCVARTTNTFGLWILTLAI